MTKTAIKCVYSSNGDTTWHDESDNPVGVIREIRGVVEYMVELPSGERRSFDKWQNARDWLAEQA